MIQELLDGMIQDTKNAINSFINSFREILGNIYDRKELDEITEYMGKGDESFLVMQLLGRPFCSKKNKERLFAYDYKLRTSRRWRLNPHTFDGEGDAVDQIERLVGRPDSADY